MVTIFSIPRPFAGHSAIIQRNAIESWRRLGSGCEIVLCADEPGTEEIAREFGLKYLPHIGRNQYGVPLLDVTFKAVREIAATPLLCCVSADIIFLDDFLTALSRISFADFLLTGRHWDIDIKEPLDFDQPDWSERLRQRVKLYGELHVQGGADYLVFPRQSAITEILPFAVGRDGWDGWVMFRARQLGIPIVDLSWAVVDIHQQHQRHPLRKKMVHRQEPDCDFTYNLQIMGGDRAAACATTFSDATHIMQGEEILCSGGRTDV